MSERYDVYKQGYLLKSPPLNVSGQTKGFKRWRKRWCVLSSDSQSKVCLHYYKNEDAFIRNKVPLGTIPTDEAFSCDAGLPISTGNSRYKFVWTVHLSRRKFCLAADSNYEMNLWVEAVLNVVPHLAPRDRRQSAGHSCSKDAHSPPSASALSTCHSTCTSEEFERDEWSDWDSDEEVETSENFNFPSPPPPLPPVPKFPFPPVC